MPEIPPILAWMRYSMRIQPSSSTLAVGMLLCGEISGESMSGAAVHGVFGENDCGSTSLQDSSLPVADSSSQTDSDSGWHSSTVSCKFGDL